MGTKTDLAAKFHAVWPLLDERTRRFLRRVLLVPNGLAMGAAQRGLDTLNADGTLTARLDQMQHRADLYDLIDYKGYNPFDSSVFTYTASR